MPRNRLIAQLDEELVQAKGSLSFWQEQALLLGDDELQAAANEQIRHREADIEQLLKAQEILMGLPNA